MMPKEELNCEKLRQILEMERMERIRKNRGLTKIDPDFYSNLTNYLNGLQKSFEEEYKINPTSPKTILLRDELNRAKNLSENIFDFPYLNSIDFINSYGFRKSTNSWASK